jgi:hypothetical protein
VQVLHPRLESSELPAVIREPRPALVEQNQPKRLSESLVEVSPAPRLPAVDEVRDEVRDVGEIDLTIAHHLTGDRNAPVACVADVEPHAAILAQISPGGNEAVPVYFWSPGLTTAGCPRLRTPSSYDATAT